jgi:hypothetical protein
MSYSSVQSVTLPQLAGRVVAFPLFLARAIAQLVARFVNAILNFMFAPAARPSATKDAIFKNPLETFSKTFSLEALLKPHMVEVGSGNAKTVENARFFGYGQDVEFDDLDGIETFVKGYDVLARRETMPLVHMVIESNNPTQPLQKLHAVQNLLAGLVAEGKIQESTAQQFQFYLEERSPQMKPNKNLGYEAIHKVTEQYVADLDQKGYNAGKILQRLKDHWALPKTGVQYYDTMEDHFKRFGKEARVSMIITAPVNNVVNELLGRFTKTERKQITAAMYASFNLREGIEQNSLEASKAIKGLEQQIKQAKGVIEEAYKAGNGTELSAAMKTLKDRKNGLKSEIEELQYKHGADQTLLGTKKDELVLVTKNLETLEALFDTADIKGLKAELKKQKGLVKEAENKVVHCINSLGDVLPYEGFPSLRHTLSLQEKVTKDGTEQTVSKVIEKDGNKFSEQDLGLKDLIATPEAERTPHENLALGLLTGWSGAMCKQFETKISGGFDTPSHAEGFLKSFKEVCLSGPMSSEIAKKFFSEAEGAQWKTAQEIPAEYVRSLEILSSMYQFLAQGTRSDGAFLRVLSDPKTLVNPNCIRIGGTFKFNELGYTDIAYPFRWDGKASQNYADGSSRFDGAGPVWSIDGTQSLGGNQIGVDVDALNDRMRAFFVESPGLGSRLASWCAETFFPLERGLQDREIVPLTA